MLARIKRIFRAILGWFIDLGESPELILRQNIKDMEDQIPAMNENLAMMKAQVTLTERAAHELAQKENTLTAKIKAALKNSRRDIALNYATTLEEVRAELVVQKKQREMAENTFAKAKKMKSAFLHGIQKKITEAQRALSSKSQAEWQAKVADAMESFQVAGIDSTHNEMVEKIEQDAAVQSAKLEIAMDKLDTFDIEEDARALQANDTLRQFEMDMGLADISAPPETDVDETVNQQVKERV